MLGNGDWALLPVPAARCGWPCHVGSAGLKSCEPKNVSAWGRDLQAWLRLQASGVVGAADETASCEAPPLVHPAGQTTTCSM